MRIVREAVHPDRRGVARKAREASAAERAAGAILNANKPMFNRENPKTENPAQSAYSKSPETSTVSRLFFGVPEGIRTPDL